MRLLITGAQGQLGHDVAQAAIQQGFDTLALTRSTLDITRADRVDRTIDARQPDLVVNCAAYTAVDRAEEESEQAFAANRDGPSHLATTCARHGIPLIHVSTDYVFDGTKDSPYTESDPLRPINTYGRSKAAGEAAVQAMTNRFVILRTAWVFGAHGNNFVRTMLRLGQERPSLRVVNDQVGCPTFTGHLAEAIMGIAAIYRTETECPWGVYHYGGQPPISWHGFADHIFTTARTMGVALKIEALEAIPTSAYPLPAKRAANSRLDCSKFERVFGLQAGAWEDGVRTVISAWLASQAIKPPE
ncbi:MAG: dTDP-4-dehydrorhamnose reductase [Desulfobacterales bacterium]|nr:dTDP-4-dehydrorhamnose reductase [Desulfobacterales bacterium]